MNFLNYLTALMFSFVFSSSALASLLVKVPVFSVTTYGSTKGTTGQGSAPYIRYVVLSVSKDDSSNTTKIAWSSLEGYGGGNVEVSSDGEFKISYERSSHNFLRAGELSGILQGNTIAVRSYEEHNINYISLTRKITRSSAPSEFVQFPSN